MAPLGVKATAAGPVPTVMVPVTAWVVVSTMEMVPAPLLLTQAWVPAGLSWTSNALEPVAMLAVMALVAGL